MGLLAWMRKSMGKNKRAFSGGLGVFNELYNPSAHSTQIIVEERREAIKPKPSPTDKDNPGNKNN